MKSQRYNGFWNKLKGEEQVAGAFPTNCSFSLSPWTISLEDFDGAVIKIQIQTYRIYLNYSELPPAAQQKSMPYGWSISVHSALEALELAINMVLNRKRRTIMTKTYFEDLQDCVLRNLYDAQKNVKIAVAWINFSLYEEVFVMLSNRGIKIKIIVNDDVKNRRYLNSLQRLQNCGVKIKFLQSIGLMHHKFCIIDKRKVLLGSFNWTISANQKHYEDLTIIDDFGTVDPCLAEFRALWELSAQDLRNLKFPEYCMSCGGPIVNILLLEQDGDYSTKAQIMRSCGCHQEIVETEYYDISLYLNYVAALNEFQEKLWDAQSRKDMRGCQQIMEEQESFLANYFSDFTRNNSLGCPIIHAVGVYTQRWIGKEDEEFYYKILWKERNTATYIEDEYPEM